MNKIKIIVLLITNAILSCSASNVDVIDVTSSTLSPSYNIYQYYGWGGEWPIKPLEQIYYESQESCDSSSSLLPATMRMRGPQRYTIGYYNNYDYIHYESYRQTCYVTLNICLTNYPANQYDDAQLVWPINEYVNTYANILNQTSMDQYFPFVGQNYTVNGVFEPKGWIPYTVRSSSWRELDILQAHVYVRKMNREMRFDPIRPDSNNAELGDPINIISGNVSLDQTDITIQNSTMPLEISRSYNSVLDYAGPMGPKWTFNYNWFLTSSNTVFKGITNNWRIIQTGDGRLLSFKRISSNSFEDAIGSNAKLSYSNSCFFLRFPPSYTYIFNTNGKLTSVADKWNNSLSISYTNNETGEIYSEIKNNYGNSLILNYTSNLITSITTPYSNYEVVYSYNDKNELTNAIFKSSSGENSFTYYYDDNHSLTQKVNSVGEKQFWDYLDNNGIKSSKGIHSYMESNLNDYAYEYTDNIITEKVDPQGNNVENQYTYDRIYKQILSIKGPYLNSTNTTKCRSKKYTYDDYGYPITCYINDGEETLMDVYSYDSGHNVTNIKSGYCTIATNRMSYLWDTNSCLLTNIIDPEGCKIVLSYNRDRIERVAQRLNNTNINETTFAYSTNGLITSVTNSNSHWQKYYYDQSGNLTSSVPQAGPSTQYEWSDLGILEKIVKPGDALDNNMPPGPIPRVTQFDSDEQGLVNSITYPDNTYEQFLYDAMQKLTNHIDIAGRSTKMTYAPGGHLESVTRYLSNGQSSQSVTTSVEYNKQFKTLSINDPLNRVVEAYSLDLQDRPVTVTNLEGQTMQINYRLENLIKSITRFDGSTVTHTYDWAGRISDIRYSDSINRYGYLKNNLRINAANENGTISNTYNGANRLTSSLSVGPTGAVSYTYYPAGQVSNVVSVAGTITYGIDAGDRTESIISTAGAFAFTYNTNNGLVSGMRCTNNGIRVSYQYGLMDNITGITWTFGSSNVLRIFNYNYNNAGLINSITREDGSFISYSQDSIDRLTEETQKDSSGNVILDEAIEYDLAGNRTSKTRDGLHVAYALGDGNRLANWSVSDTNLSVQCDVLGTANEPIGAGDQFGLLWVSNVIAAKPTVSGTNFVALDFPVGLGTQKIVAAICDKAGNTSYTTNTVFMTIITNAQYAYSPAGCLTNTTYKGAEFTKTISCIWNSQYQLTETRTNGIVAEKNGYDALGRRAWESNSGSTNYFVYDGNQVVAEVNSTGKLLRAYTAASGVDQWLAMTVCTGSVTKTYFYLTDHLGTIHALADELGNVVESYQYDAWGRVLGVYGVDGAPLTESAVGNRYLWQGREYSWKTGYYYFRARWYDPIVGRWLSNDPIGISGGLNQYVFCGNDPVNNRDPFGLCHTYQDNDSIEEAFGDLFNVALIVFSSGASIEAMVAAQRPTTINRIRSVAQSGFDYAIENPQVQGLNRMLLGKDAEVQATRWLRRWAERNNISLGEGGLRFQVRGANSVPDVVFDPAKRILDFKLTPKAIRPAQSANFEMNFPGYSVDYIFGPGSWR